MDISNTGITNLFSEGIGSVGETGNNYSGLILIGICFLTLIGVGFLVCKALLG